VDTHPLISRRGYAMQLNVKTILNLKENCPCFVFDDIRLITGKGKEPRIEAAVEPRKGL
jgi:hypothetical protein